MDAQQILSLSPVMPVVALHDAEAAVDLAHALHAGGIGVLEITLRTPSALTAIANIRRALPDVLVGAGTVLDAAQLAAAADAGAQFAISPGINPAFAEACARAPVPVIPGVATAGEVMLASAHGFGVCKLFPAEAAGGRALLKAWHAPFAHMRFCPTGGISPDNAADYLRLPNVLCVGGSWLTPPDVLARRDWHTVTALARQAAAWRSEQGG
ncbi:bifunctional 4-hydroxy-2-oxoglutarate aldolase/2-dehydro-3-deoxy-phosphogluconate aldolase [Conchiformibius kuhniae]|uniref:2-dehydro-3-deoxy-phosphogluconate aldolase n=1 Tax=Conchiformibius kuhniae TaxID=211502 RepID=A0ABD8B748_9NEIS|nr:bifunctional 4-hydroxy-2-oxoglutarate aldolase/2-dehydro-3-deoxy-phosphogluconate aldolase [Conchiformibius kuhniae]